MHECETCGQMCDCDGDDLDCPQPEDCDHLKDGDCRDDEDWPDSYDYSDMGKTTDD